MNIFAISDLHLSGLSKKPMDIFGSGWEGHFDKIKTDWNKKVSPQDVVLVCGDISWGMSFDEGMYDLCLLKELAGRKVFIRGNHDYWWSGITKLRRQAPDETFFFLQNDCVKFDDVIICGSRGWTCPGSSDYTEHDEKLYLREVERFKLCFKEVNKMREDGDKVLVMTHYPPFSLKSPQTEFTKLFKEERADKVIFGHIHGETYFPLYSKKDGIDYILTSCDKVGFALQKIL